MSGFAEQVYLIRPRADKHGRAMALLHNVAATAGVALRWNVASLPYFNLWKNTAAIEDGYVTGLEPATGFPRFRGQEREAGRVWTLATGETFAASWTVEILDSAAQVAAMVEEVARQQGNRATAVINRVALPS